MPFPLVKQPTQQLTSLETRNPKSLPDLCFNHLSFRLGAHVLLCFSNENIGEGKLINREDGLKLTNQ